MQDSVASTNEAANEVVSGIRVVRSFNTEKHEACRYDRCLMDTHKLKTRRDTVRAIYLLTHRVRSFYSFFFLLFLCMSPKGTFELIITYHHIHRICLCFCVCLQLTGLIMQVFVLFYGRLFIQRGQMTTGNLVSFILYHSDLGDNIRVSHNFLFSFRIYNYNPDNT